MAQKYVIDVEGVEDYTKYIKKFKRQSEEKKRNINKQLKKIHEVWNDEVYDKTVEAIDEVDKTIEKLYTSLDETIKCLNKMTQAYNDYLNGGK